MMRLVTFCLFIYLNKKLRLCCTLSYNQEKIMAVAKIGIELLDYVYVLKKVTSNA